MRQIVFLALAVVIAGCAGGTPEVPPIPAPPKMDAESCYNLNHHVYVIEQSKKLSGHYGKGEERRLEQLRIAALVLGCWLDPEFQPRV